jgi:methyltransferase (TIGR00027 family)
MFTALKRIAYHVGDLDAATVWYAAILGKEPVFRAPFASIFVIGDCSLSLSKDPSAQGDSASATEVYWEVADVEGAYRRLLEAGASARMPVREVMNICIAQVVDPFGTVLGITGPPPDLHKRSVEDRPSATAMTVAFCRALAARDEREGITGPDTLAEIFLSEEGKGRLQDAASREWAIRNLVTVPLYGYFIARTSYFDRVFQEALEGGVPQIVLLGAGYDTRSWRFKEHITKTRVFELDITSTQESKRAALRTAGIDIPGQVTLVRIDFKSQDLESVLADAGYDPLLRTLFIWEGVTYYLTEEAVNGTLRFVHRNSPRGSTLCFDYLTEKLGSVNPAEPFLFWKHPMQMKELLSGRGFKVIEELDAEEMERRYLTQRDGTLAARALPLFRFVHAESAREAR